MTFPLRGCILAAAFLLPAANAAAPYTPVRDDVVLERVPPADDPRARELAALRRELHQSPDDGTLAARYVQAAIERGRATADPRWLGYAAATLDSIAAWRDEAQAPPVALTLRATMLQQRHDFAGAFALLDRALTLDPGFSQARLTRAVLHQVQGRPQAARQDCAALVGRAPEPIALACVAGALSLSGRAADALRLLSHVDATPRGESGTLLWPLTLRAEIHHRLGDMESAEPAFQEALDAMRKSGTPDFYLLGARADFLLDAGRAAEVEPLLAPYPETDGLLLRRALAAQALNDSAAIRQRQALATRFTEQAARGDDAVHLRERAWFELALNRNAAAALELAARNWRTQREPLDAQLLLQATLATGNLAAAQPVLDWMDETGIEDPRLHQLRRQLAAS